MKQSAVISSPVGNLKLWFKENKLCALDLNCEELLDINDSLDVQKVKHQISEYFDSADNLFKLELLVQGTDFQHRVWSALRQIPVGSVKTYGQLAKELESSARAVGNACRRNPTPLVVPCHRVVAASGLGGFAGQTSGRLTSIKQQLLRHEGVNW